MKIFGLEITRRKRDKSMTSLRQASWWSPFWGPISESYAGAWQQGVTVDSTQTLLSNSAVYCCITGISSDIAKLGIKITENHGGIWEEITRDSSNARVLRKPNHFQTRIKFIEQWMTSKLIHGNTYVLKRRETGMWDDSKVVAMYVLDPQRVTPLISDAGGVYYQLKQDYLAGILGEDLVIPSSEIMHDVMAPLWHPLIGIGPLYACALSTTMGNKIQGNSTKFFENRSMPGGMLTSPGRISEDTAKRMKLLFETNFGGDNFGRLFVGGDGLKFEPFSLSAENSQLIEQLKWSVSDVARAFHYPEFKLGGPTPPYAGNMQALSLLYYTDCLQPLIEELEDCLDSGLDMPLHQAVECDIDNLLRMDTASLFEANNKAVGGGWMAPDEARMRANLAKVPGGGTPYLQQQNYSLAALAKRDAQDDPFGGVTAAPAGAPPPDDPPKSTKAMGGDDDEDIGEMVDGFYEGLAA